MGKCLITKLNGSINNESVLHLGELRINFKKAGSITVGSQAIGLNVTKPVTIEIIGAAYFTDQTLTKNLGRSQVLNAGLQGVFIYADTDVSLAILDKYSVSTIEAFYPGQPDATVVANNKYFSLESLKYMPALRQLSFSKGTLIDGDIASLATNKELRGIYLSNTNVGGDISNLAGLTLLKNISLADTNVYGDTSNLSDLTSLVTVNFIASRKVTGNLSDFNNLVNLTKIEIDGTGIYGDIASLAKAHIALGRTSGTLVINANIGSLTIDGVPTTNRSNSIKFADGSYTIS